MQIVSYREPFQTGGVAALIQTAQQGAQWWYVQGEYLERVSLRKHGQVTCLPAGIVEGHLRYCERFLWPLLHGQPEDAQYGETDHNCYRSFNVAVAAHLSWRDDMQDLLVQDYQFALLPMYLSEELSTRVQYFHHIPWPRFVPLAAEAHLAELARGMLRCGEVIFRTADDLGNFRGFVKQLRPDGALIDEGSASGGYGRRTRLMVGSGSIDQQLWRSAGEAVLAFNMEE